MLAVGSVRMLGPTEPKAPGRARARVGRSRDLDFISSCEQTPERGWRQPDPRRRPSEQLLRGRGQPAVTHDGNETPALHISHAIINTDARGTRIVTTEPKELVSTEDQVLVNLLAGRLAVLVRAQVGLVPHRVQDVRHHEPEPSVGARLSDVFLLPLSFVEPTEQPRHLPGLLEDLLDQGSLMVVLDIQIEDALSRSTMPTSFWRLARHSLTPSTGSLLGWKQVPAPTLPSARGATFAMPSP